MGNILNQDENLFRLSHQYKLFMEKSWCQHAIVRSNECTFLAGNRLKHTLHSSTTGFSEPAEPEKLTNNSTSEA